MNPSAYIYIFILSLIISLQSKGQTMLFNSSDNVIELDFTSDPPTLQAQGNSQIPVIDENYECIGRAIDCDGQTLFTFVNHGVYDQFNNLMPGSVSSNIDLSSAEVAIVPDPADVNLYYIFYSDGQGCANILYMTLDMSLNGGLGDVTSLDQLLDSGFHLEGMESIRIPDSNNYRLMLYEYDTGLKSYLIDETGISGGDIIYNFSPDWEFPFGFSCNSELDYHNGKLGYSYGWSRVISLMDYDPVSNVVSSPIILNDPIFNPSVSTYLNRGSAYGIEFSPDATKAYITNRWTGDLVQYNFLTGTITLIPLPITTPDDTGGISQIELGPDGKLYISGRHETVIHVVDNPNDDIVTTSTIPVIGFTLDEGIEDPPAIHPLLVSGVVDLGEDGVICNETMVLDAGYPGATYLWQDGSTEQTFVVTQTGTYTVEVDIGCLLYGEIDLVVSELIVDLGNDTLVCEPNILLDAGLLSSTYLWQDNSANQTFLVNDFGVYWVTVENEDGCMVTDTIEVIQSGIEINLGDDISSCDLEVNLDAGGEATSYLWQDGSSNQMFFADQPGTYSVEVMNETGCVSSDTIVLSIGEINLDLGEDFLACIGNTEMLGAGGAYDTYLWSTGETMSNIEVFEDGEYTLTVTEGICESSDTIYVDFYLPEALFEASIPAGCPTLEVIFNDLSTSEHGEINSWQWEFGDGAISLLTNPSNFYTQSGEYQVELIISDEHNCDDSALLSYLIEVYDEPEAMFSFSPDHPSEDDPLIQFTDESLDAISWVWQFADEGTSIEQNPSHVFAEGGEYNVNLEVTNEEGCTDIVTWTVVVDVPLSFYVPNAFTPDGDGLNDLFAPVISGQDIQDYSMTIFDRWGAIVFQSSDYSEKWNGAYGGKLLGKGIGSEYFVMNGVYPWIITLKQLGSTDKKVIRGEVTIVR